MKSSQAERKESVTSNHIFQACAIIRTINPTNSSKTIFSGLECHRQRKNLRKKLLLLLNLSLPFFPSLSLRFLIHVWIWTPFLILYFLFKLYNLKIKFCKCQDLNCESLVLKATAQTTEEQPLPFLLHTFIPDFFLPLSPILYSSSTSKYPPFFYRLHNIFYVMLNLSTFLSFFFFPCFRPFLLFSSFSLSLYLVFIFFRRRKKIFFFFWRSFNFCFKSICQSQFRVRLFSVCPQRDVPKLLKRSSFFLSF